MTICKNILSLVIPFSIVACGTDPDIEYFTKHEVAVYCLEDVCYPIEQVEFVIDILLDQLDKKAVSIDPNYNKEESLYRLSLGRWIGRANHQPYRAYIKKEQTGEIGSCATEAEPDRVCRGFKCHVGWCMGISKSKDGVIWSVHHECIGRSALTHEFMHLLNYTIEGVSDGNHSRETFFPSGCRFRPTEEWGECRNNSAVGATKNIVTEAFCE